MDNQILAHTKYNCTYHIVFISKYRRIENIDTNIGNHIIEGPCCDARKSVVCID